MRVFVALANQVCFVPVANIDAFPKQEVGSSVLAHGSSKKVPAAIENKGFCSKKSSAKCGTQQVFTLFVFNNNFAVVVVNGVFRNNFAHAVHNNFAGKRIFYGSNKTVYLRLHVGIFKGKVAIGHCAVC